MVSDDGTSDSNGLGAGVDEKDGGLARIIGDIFSADSAMVESSKPKSNFNRNKNFYYSCKKSNIR